MIWVAVACAVGIAGLTAAYFIFPHVASRIDRFIDPAAGDNYQTDKAMEAFMNGGQGRGPGEGTVKTTYRTPMPILFWPWQARSSV